MISPRELEETSRSFFFFFNWYKNDHYIAYAFTSRPVARHPYERPFAFYTNVVSFHQDTNHNQTVGIHSPRKSPHPHVLSVENGVTGKN